MSPWARVVGEIALGTALVGLVVVLEFPWGESQEDAKRFACLSDLKQQAIGLTQYAEDHDERFALRGDWMDAIRPYVLRENVFHHPGPNWRSFYDYAFDAALSSAKAPNKGSETLPLVYDSTHRGRNGSDFFTSVPLPGRHEGKDNVAYADGHARAVKVK